jgi:hypothetical protein
MTPKHTYSCLTCGKEAMSCWRHCKFCCAPCRNLYYKRNQGIGSAYHNVPKATVGAIAELRVATDLLAKGFEIFRAISPSCSCDLACLKDGKLLRIEVKTGYRGMNGKLTSLSLKDPTKTDILAVVVGETISYRPELSVS